MSSRARLAWALLALVLVGGPLAITLDRASSFSASVEVFPTHLRPLPSVRNADQLRTLLHTPGVRDSALAAVGMAPGSQLAAAITPSPQPRRTWVLTASAKTPQDAVALDNALGDSLRAPARIVLRSRPGPPALTRPGDRLVNALPGTFPPRPSPIWPGLAGLLVFAVLWLGWLSWTRHGDRNAERT